MHPYSVKLLKAERAACSSPLNSIVPPLLSICHTCTYRYVCSSTYFVHSITAASALGGAHAVAAPAPLHHSPVYGRSFRPLYSLLALYRRRLCFAAAATVAAAVTNEGCG